MVRPVRIAVDIDSTLHHYWDQLSAIAKRRFGVELPHDDQVTWTIKAATARWLERIGLPYDELYCSWDKVARCREIAIDVLIDDSPVNLLKAGEAGITPATILHPWNRELCEEEDLVCAPDWPTLARRLEPVLA